MKVERGSLCDEHIYSAIFREYAHTLFNYLYYKCGQRELARDIMQESFLRLWLNCAKVSLKTAKGYVFQIANNQLRNTFDHQKVKLKFQQKAPQQTNIHDPEFILIEKEFGEELERAISDLPEKQRVVFLLSRIDKKTYQEIADLLDISKKAVEKRMYQSLLTLRKTSNKIR